MSVVWRWEPIVFCKVALHFVGCFAYDTCMFMVIRLPCTYLCIFSAVLARFCIFYCVANRCDYGGTPMRHRKTACFEALVLEPNFAQSCRRFLLLY